MRLLTAGLLAAVVSGCSVFQGPPEPLPVPEATDYTYIIGPGDSLSIFVWRNPEISQSVTVRPDGRISAPLIEELRAAGKTPVELARDITEELSQYVRDPLVTVMVGGFNGVFSTQVRVLGEAAEPRAIPYQDSMTVLDVMIAVGGLTEFAAGNKAKLVRRVDGELHQTTVRLEDLIKDGDITANVPVAPGDVLIIPEAWF